MGYQPRGKPIDPSKLKPPPSGTGVTMPATRGEDHYTQRMCFDCFHKGELGCPFVEVHPFARACHRFTRRITDFRFSIGADVDPDSVRVTVDGIDVEPTHMPSGGTTVLKAEIVRECVDSHQLCLQRGGLPLTISNL